MQELVAVNHEESDKPGYLAKLQVRINSHLPDPCLDRHFWRLPVFSNPDMSLNEGDL